MANPSYHCSDHNLWSMLFSPFCVSYFISSPSAKLFTSLIHSEVYHFPVVAACLVHCYCLSGFSAFCCSPASCSQCSYLSILLNVRWIMPICSQPIGHFISLSVKDKISVMSTQALHDLLLLSILPQFSDLISLLLCLFHLASNILSFVVFPI